MKILDKYVAKNFLIGYAIAFCVLIGLRIIIDLFVNLDEFTEHADLGALAVVGNILSFYTLHSLLYFRDFAGMITVVAAAFSLGKMIHLNELVAVMASGVSLKRVIVPIILLAFLLDSESQRQARAGPGCPPRPGNLRRLVYLRRQRLADLHPKVRRKNSHNAETDYNPSQKKGRLPRLGGNRPNIRHKSCLQPRNRKLGFC
jgi:hypothetical protein